MRIHPSLVALLLLSGSAAGEIDHSLSLSVVQVQAYPASGKVSLGSGVVIDGHRVATNCHITQRAYKVVVSKGAERFDAVTQRVDVQRDLCILDAPTMQLPQAKLGHTEKLKQGETLYLYGYPRAIGVSFSQGKVQSLHPFKRGLIIETSADFAEGASGGGIFNDHSELMGLATFFSRGLDRHYYAIPASWIHTLNRSRAETIKPLEGLPFWLDFKHLPAFLRKPGH